MAKYLVIKLLILACLDLSGQDLKEGAALLERGNQLYSEGKYSDAVVAFDQCISSHPQLKDAFLGRAMSKEQLKNFQGAIADYSVFLEANPQHFEALLGRANSRYNAAMFEQAKQDYLILLSLPTGETNYILFQRSASTEGTLQITTAQSNMKSRIYNSIGLTEYNLKNYDQALHWLDSAIKAEPNNADYYVNRGMVHEKTSAEIAMDDYNAALKINPNHALALHNIGVLKGNKEPVDYLEKAIESDSTMLAPYLERGYQRMESGYYKGALDDYNSAIAIEKNDPEIWLNRGLAREKLNDLKGAYADYSQAISLDEDFEKAWLNRGNISIKLGKFKEAIEDYTVAISIDPEYGAAYYNRAIAKEKAKQKAEACDDVRLAEKYGIAPDAKLKTSVCP